ncbi:MAG TPA: hypothetical protein VG603_08405 [Chitinophagales bacterium]|nr:hypothetical protein [Chitinophagales bacterium]
MKYLPPLTYVWCILIGMILIIWTPLGPIHICIACGPSYLNLAGGVSVLIGIAGLATRKQQGMVAG